MFTRLNFQTWRPINFAGEKNFIMTPQTSCLIWLNTRWKNVWLDTCTLVFPIFPCHTVFEHILELKHDTHALRRSYKNTTKTLSRWSGPFFSRYKPFFTLTMATFSRTIAQKSLLFCAIDATKPTFSLDLSNAPSTLYEWKKARFTSVLVACSAELSDPRHIRDDTEKRYSFIQKSFNEVSLGKLLWCDFLFILFGSIWVVVLSF